MQLTVGFSLNWKRCYFLKVLEILFCSNRVAELCEKISKLHSKGVVEALHGAKMENSPILGLEPHVNGTFDDTDDEEKLVFVIGVNRNFFAT